MDTKTQESQRQDVLFAHLVMMFSQTAMVQLGKLLNPATGKTEVDLDGAQASIDMLDMIRAKTAGNLDAREARLVNDMLSNLQLNYVETAAAAPGPSAEPDAESVPATEASPQADAPAADANAGTTDEASPRFHKAYGG